MVGAIGELGAEARRLDLVHQTGPSERDQVAAGYGRLGVAARVEEFITDMGAAYAAADLVVARAGAMSCTEIAVVGRPAILLPYPHAADDHQRRNAEILVRAGAAEMILEPELGTARLAATLRALLADDARRVAMGERARAIGRPDAAERIVAECQGLVDRWWSGVPLATPGNGRRDLKRS